MQIPRCGELRNCNNPNCTICPKTPKPNRASMLANYKHNSELYSDAKVRVERRFSCRRFILGIVKPQNKRVQQWIKFFVIACLVAVFVDPLFFFLLTTQPDNKCIVINQTMTKTLVVFRSMTDSIYFLHILLQFKLAYVAPESRAGGGEIVDEPKKIALNYLRGYFFIDLFIVLPLPQMIIKVILPLGANHAKNNLRTAILVQYLPRLYRVLPMLAGQSPNGFIFETAWANFIINLLTFMLSGHLVGSCWYLFGLQRVNQCLRNACHNSEISKKCMKFLDCGSGYVDEKFQDKSTWKIWKSNANSTACFTESGFSYGIYNQAVNLTTQNSIIRRYVYSLFWGFQQISTLAGNLTPSYFVWEVLFTMAIIGLGLLLFALLIGNMQNFLQSLGRRRLEMSLKRRDFERWMSYRGLPDELRKQVRRAERYNWSSNRGVNEAMLLENLPEEIQRDIRRHLFKFVKKVRIFAVMDDVVLDSIYKRLKHNIFIKGSKILHPGSVVEKMVFILRGKLESVAEDGTVVFLSEGDFFGEELLCWSLEQSSLENGDGKKKSLYEKRLLSNRTIRCLTDVEAFALRSSDLKEFTCLREFRVQAAIRYESPYWRSLAATRIQKAWRYMKKRLNIVHSDDVI